MIEHSRRSGDIFISHASDAVNIMLEKIKSPADLKWLNEEELTCLSSEIREKILETVSENGGHLASNLGIVELTVAIHRVFFRPEDKIIFDVGHQCYAHKLLTGRADKFDTLRKRGGISGFTNRDESDFDTVTAGHSGSSVSAALGVAQAAALSGSDAHTVAIVGDGSFTNGMIYEALNNCAGKKLKLIIVLNDNGMSISPNVGGLSDYFSRIRTSSSYFSFKCFMNRHVSKIPIVGKHVVNIARRIKNFVKRISFSDNLFESMGLDYLGPVDGHDMEKLTAVLREAGAHDECTIVHVRTKKGFGFEPSERAPHMYHSTAPFDRKTGNACHAGSVNTFTDTVSETLCRAAETDHKICAVCAAMTDGVGLDGFADLYPDRFFDVGIAEEHAVTFSGGLSISGYHPVCVLYSTFAQRVYDQMFHDIVLQKTPMTLLLSHAGFVPGDGVTHQGIYDVALFSSIPNIRIFSPDNYSELSLLLADSLSSPYADIIRYPKGSESEYDRTCFVRHGDVFSCVPEGAEAVILTYGRISALAVSAVAVTKALCGVVRVSRLLPIPTDEILEALDGAKLVYILEEGIKQGGFAERFASAAAEHGFYGKIIIHAIDGALVPHGTVAELYEKYGFTEENIAEKIDFALADMQ